MPVYKLIRTLVISYIAREPLTQAYNAMGQAYVVAGPLANAF